MKMGWWIGLLCLIFAAAGCGANGPAETTRQQESRAESTAETKESQTEESSAETEESSSETKETQTEPEESSSEKAEEPFRFVDAHGEWFETVLRPEVARHSYDWAKLSEKEGRLTYEDEAYQVHFGIDVSHHQGEIDWESAAAAGVEFAIVRIAYRGYGESGNLMADRTAMDNLEAAEKAGILTGVYVFSQAVNEAEAKEEAEFVLELLVGRELALPVVFDPELIRDEEARTDDVTGEQFTKNVRAFAETIRAAGYEPMIYANMYWEAFLLDLAALSDLPVWYADYEPAPQTPYDFTFWQYSESGSVPGIAGLVDLDLWFERK